MAKTGKDVIVWVRTYKDPQLGKVPTPAGVDYESIVVRNIVFQVVNDWNNQPIGFGLGIWGSVPENQVDKEVTKAEELFDAVQTWFDEWSFPYKAAVCTFTSE